jgi:hypothetical protein
LLILINVFANIFRETSTEGSSIFTFFNTLFMNVGPFAFIITLVSLVILILTKHRQFIINNDVPSKFKWYNESIVLLVMMILGVIYSGLSSEKFETSGLIPDLMNSMLYLFSVLTLMSYTTLHSILSYYSTDGFNVM